MTPHCPPLEGSSKFAALKDACHISGVPTTWYIPNVSPRLGATNLAYTVARCTQKLYFFEDHGGRSLACRLRVGRVTGLLVSCWLGRWPGDLRNRAGLFTCSCFGRGFSNCVSKERTILGGAGSASRVCLGSGVGSWNRPGPQLVTVFLLFEVPGCARETLSAKALWQEQAGRAGRTKGAGGASGRPQRAALSLAGQCRTMWGLW